MRRRRVSFARCSVGRPESDRWPLATSLGTVSVALAGACSFGYLMFRSRDHSDAGALPAFVAAQEVVQSSERLELWRGLPRATGGAAPSGIVSRTFGAFEEAPVPLREEDVPRVRAFCTREADFWQRTPNTYTLCGGYHADWSIVFAGRKGTAEFSFCFGCGEVKILVDGYAPLHLGHSSSVELMQFMEPYRSK